MVLDRLSAQQHRSALRHIQLRGQLPCFRQSPRWQSDRAARIPTSFPDGTSNTIILSEKTGWCGASTTTAYSPLWLDVYGPAENVYFTPSFCDTAGTNGYTPCAMFTVQPKWFNCNPAVASSNHTGGIPVAMGDGSLPHCEHGHIPDNLAGRLRSTRRQPPGIGLVRRIQGAP